VSGEEELTLNQAIEFFAYRDLERARKAPVYVSERDFRPKSLMASWDPKVTTGVWSLWHALEEGPVTAIRHDRPVPRSRWSAERLSRLAPDEPTAIGPFIKELQRSVAHIRFRAAELVGLFSASAKPSGEPPSLQADNKPLPAIDEEPSASRRRGRPSGHRWGIVDPKVEALVEQYGPYETIAAAVEAVNTELEDAGEEPFDSRWAERRIKRDRAFPN
jgi:hypothetical protein